MEKIVITGGLGYIGTELCKIYSGESRYKDITVIDTRFVSARVEQLRKWGMKFVQCSILDLDRVSEIVKDADTIIHLAGITDVAYTQTESNSDQDLLIKKTGIDGTRNLIKSAKDNCRFVFPSTHVIFEGLDEPELSINENRMPCPVLSYAKGKYQSELDLRTSSLNYAILRLASVYGYSGDTMRINIMPNLFAKIASQEGTIKLFNGGKQWKSLVSVYDVARCIHFMANNPEISRDVFNVSNENVTVADVAYKCAKFSNVNIIETEDEVPNLGYTLSNKRLLKTGFEFLYSLDKCLEDMINRWSAQNIRPELEYCDKGGNEYIDDRGIINNYELTEPINLIGYIESCKGSVRANHYHPIQEQKCLLIKGQYISVTQDLSVDNAKIETKIINEGDIAIIKPNVAHAMVFTKDSIFLNLVNGERDHDNYGITHTIPYILVDENTRQKLLSIYKTQCRCCDGVRLEKVLSLGESPLANNLKDIDDLKDVDTYPLELNYCLDCHNCQLSVVVPPEKMFDEYLYLSSTSQSFVKHFEEAAEKYVKRFKLDENSTVIDIGSNDGIALKPFQKKGIKVLGIEPATNIAKIANEQGIPTYNSYFNDRAISDIFNQTGLVDIVTASNVFAHSDNLVEMLYSAFMLLKEDGTFIVEVQYLLSTMQDLTFDNIYHEHVNYWSVTSLSKFCDIFHLKLYDVEFIDTHGGSIRAYIKRKYDYTENSLYGEQAISKSVRDFIAKEEQFGLTKLETYKQFGDHINYLRDKVRKNMDSLKDTYFLIAGYGSPAKATTALNFFGINYKDISYTIEDNELKNNKYIPGVNIPIKNKEYAHSNLPDLIIVLAWNFYDTIVANNQDLVEKGVKFISIKDLLS